MTPNIFVFEGLDYTGKSSLAQHCKEELEKFYPGKVSLYRNPGGTPLGEKIRDIARIDSVTLLEQIYAFMLGLVSVKDQVEKDILEGKIVLLDRWFLSLLAYQVSNLKDLRLSLLLHQLCDEHTGFAHIGQTAKHILLDVDFDTMEERLAASIKTDTKDRFEGTEIQYRQSVHKNYQTLFLDMKNNKKYGYVSLELDTSGLSLEKCKAISFGHILKTVESNT